MRVKDLNSGLTPVTPPQLILDAKTFILKSPETGEYYVPPWIQVILDRAYMEYGIVALWEPDNGGLMSTIRGLLRRKPEKYPSLGKDFTLPLEKWRGIVKEHGSPLLYVGEPSNSDILYHVPAVDRIPFPSDITVLRVLVENYRTREGLPAEMASMKVMDVREAHRNRSFSKGRNTRFMRKFL